ncbi:MAG: SpaA isopeptide-forming pilin-related protein, partial [Lachnospiraceae bacterium]|nr:SpaA isopeptide-forming pilin-related protein [Lachnospiraceae bacterium]
VEIKKGATSGIAITNTYTQDTGSLKLTKTFNGLTAEEQGSLTPEQKQKIKFEIKQGGTVILTVTYDEFTNGKYTVDKLPVGNYTVVESGADALKQNYSLSVSYQVGDTSTDVVEIKKGATSEIAITNTYTRDLGNLQISKEFTGAEDALTDAQKKAISFTITGPKDFGTNGVNTITYADFQEGVYEYTNIPTGDYSVEESNADVDDYYHVVTYSVEDGKTSVTKDKTSAITIKNTYSKVEVPLSATKQYINHVLNGEDFQFKLETLAEDGTVSDTKTGFTNSSVGLIDFGSLTFTAPGTYAYRISEIKPEDAAPNIVYDQNSIKMMIKVYVDSESKKLKAEKPVYEKNNAKVEEAIFKNTYINPTEFVPQIQKQLTGAGAAVSQEEFTFNLISENEVVDTASVKASSAGVMEVKFEKLSYDKAGTYTYEIKEVKGNNENVSYSTDTITLTVLVGQDDEEANHLKVLSASYENGKKEASNVIINAVKSVKVNKTDITSDDEIDNAVISIYAADEKGNKTGTVLASWSSKKGENADFSKYVEFGKTYVLEETAAPDGYAFASNTVFTVNLDGTISTEATVTNGDVILVEDAPIKFIVNKVDVADSEEVAGAELTVLDSKGNVVDKWTSAAGKTHDFGSKLTAGESYVLRETVAPNGYTIAADIAFTVAKDGKITANAKTTTDAAGNTVYLVGDAQSTVTFKKTDLAGKELKGAELKITDADGKTVKDVMGNEIKSWISDGSDHVVKGLLNGKYIFTEISSPNGYAVAESIPFEIKDGKVVGNETDVIIMKDDVTKVSITKTDITGEKEIPGATLQVIDKEGKVVEEWVSTDKAHEINNKLIAGSEYTLHEEGAPTGYAYTADVKFTVDKTGKVTPVVMKDEAIKFIVNKVDVADSKEVAGAELTVLDSKGNVVDKWTSAAGETHDFGSKLTAGESYVLRETVAPNGYTIAADIAFTVAKDGKITANAKTTTDAAGNTVYLVEDAQSTVTFKKTDLAGKELKGAELKITDADGKTVKDVMGNEIKSWISDGSDHVVKGLLNGKYIFTEISSPNGYAVAESIPFEIKDGKVVGNETDVIIMKDDVTKVSITKTDITGEKEIPGATLQVIDKEGKVVEEWVSTDKAHEINNKLIAGSEYTLHEEGAPTGYAYTADVKFTVDKTGKVTPVVMKDEAIKFIVNKVDVADSKEVAGAELTVLDSKGNVVDKWTSAAGETHDFGSKLIAGESYVLRETVAPNGYTIAADIAFTVAKDGKITANAKTTTDAAGNTVYLVEDARTIQVSKVDIGTGAELTGAHIQVLDGNNKVIDEWDSEAGKTHAVKNVTVGTEYTLRETVAPAGYQVTTDTKFTVNADGTVTGTVVKNSDGIVLVEDKLAQSKDTSVSVQKTVSYNGLPLVADDLTFYVALYYDKDCTKTASEMKTLTFNGTDTAAVAEFNNLEVGRTYYVGECDADGKVITSGEVLGGVSYQAKFTGTNGNVVTVKKDSNTIVMLDNQLGSWPDGFYVDASLTVNKKVLDTDGKALTSKEVFYAGIFSDADYTTLAENVESNILKLDMAGGSEASASTLVALSGMDDVKTLYVTEVNADGTPTAGAKGFAYEVSVDGTKVTLDTGHLTASVTITNKKKNVETETEKKTDTEKKTTTTGKSVKTGDDTPIIPISMAMLISGMAVLLLLSRRRRKEN